MKIKLICGLIFFTILACNKTHRIPNSELNKKSQLTEEEFKDASKKYKIYCVACHGVYGGLKINGSPDLSKLKITVNERIEVVTNGKGLMTPFKGLLNPNEIELISKYLFYLDEQKQKSKKEGKYFDKK